MKNALAQHLINVVFTIPEDGRDPITDWIEQLNTLIHVQFISPLEFDRNESYLRDCVASLVLNPEDQTSKGFYHLFCETLRVDCFSFLSNLVNRDIRLGTMPRRTRLLEETREFTKAHYDEWMQEAQEYIDTTYPVLPPQTRLVLARLQIAILHSVW